MAPSLLPVSLASRRVWFVTSDEGRARAALLRAHALSRLLDGELSVLQLGSSRSVRALHRWCHAVLPGCIPFERVHWAAVGPAGIVTALPREETPDLIVLPAEEVPAGDVVTRLARSARAPVLVAHPSSPGRTIVVAIEGVVENAPLVGEASGLARRLQAPLLLIHNVAPAEEDDDESHALTVRTTLRRVAHMRYLASAAEVGAETVVTRRATAAEAVVLAARGRRADVVVIGLHRQHWLDRLTRALPIASTVVEQAGCSVLVVPMVDGAARPFSSPLRVAPADED